jgi:two-component system sensor histidine kinase KdpD
VALVDDFGRHTRAIGSLRDAGIDVISTVDVCDLERAAETVQQITGQPAAATVPDAALAEAEEIRFLDNSPAALRKRLGHGNIYPGRPPGPFGQALEGLFRTENLAALREIGLRVVAETLAVPGVARPREPQDVLVAVTVPDQADLLVQRGVRLARRSSATCTVLTFSAPPGPAAQPAGAAQPAQPAQVAGVAGVAEVAGAAGAAVMVRPGPAVVATIAQAVRETGATNLVMAVPPAGWLDRWRPGLVERVADQLPDVYLHLTVGRPGPPVRSDHGAGAQDSAAGAARRRGTIRVYLGYAAGCGITTAMLEEAGRRRSRGSDVVVAAVDCRGREGVSELLHGLELIGDGTALDTGAVLARHPEVVCIDDLSAVSADGESRLAAARRIAEAGIAVVATVHLGQLQAGDGADETAALALADEIELVDAPPSVLADRVRRGEIVPAAAVDHALHTEYRPEALGALREQAFTIVAEHADQQLAAYRQGSWPAGDDAPPVILGCVAPRPGMEPLIRWSAALAARLAGEFRVAVVTPSPPPPADPVLARYAALTGQLGGRFDALRGTPAAALAGFARQHHVTELVLARAAEPAGRRPAVLRELIRAVGGLEVHLLPAQAH